MDRHRLRLSMRDVKQVAEEVTVRIDLILDTGGAVHGTGFIVSATPSLSFILTNRHVLDDVVIEQSFVFYPATNQYARFDVVDCPPQGADLALVATRLKLHNIPSISWRKCLEKGEGVSTFGFPAGEPSYNIGTFARRNNDHNTWDGLQTESKWSEMCVLSTGAGSSGSAVFDSYGDVVGVVSKGMAGRDDLTYIVPVPYVRHLLRKNGIAFSGLGESSSLSGSETSSPGLFMARIPYRPEVQNRNLSNPQVAPRDYDGRRREVAKRQRRLYGSKNSSKRRQGSSKGSKEIKLLCLVM